MISEQDQKTIREIARKYHASQILLFGSSLSESRMARDIDIAVAGIADKDFFAFYGELMCALSKPVDVIDLSGKSKFVELVIKEGVVLHA